MKQKIFLIVLLIGVLFHANAQNSGKTIGCNYDSSINRNYSKAASLQAVMNKYTALGLPGLSMAIYTEKEGWWAGAAGYSDIEKKTAMEICHLQYLQSVSKTYMAVAILKLHEEGKIDFDAPMTKYLPSKYAKYIRDAEKITVRMLLNHTSGVAEYSIHPQFTSFVIEHPLTNFSAEDCLKSISKEGLQFTPGSKFKYTNTNYQLLSLIGDAITGDHSEYIRKNIFETLDLRSSYYSNNHNYLKRLPLTESYWDMLNVGKPANVSGFQQVNVSSLKGDDGIVSTPLDVTRFLKSLMEGKLLSPASMKEMMEFVKNEEGKPKYGMGIFYYDLGGIIGYGHSGGGIGAGCIMLYIPVLKTYLFLATNLGVLVDGELSKKANDLQMEILTTIAQ